MRKAIGLLAAVAVVLSTAPAFALEKTSVRMIDREDNWNASTTSLTIKYYNTCTGWIWVWSGWSPGETMGVNFDLLGCDSQFLSQSWALTYSGVPSGYGFTGTIVVLGGHTCSSPILAAQSFLPPVTSGWSMTSWGGIPIGPAFAINIIWGAAPNFTNGTGLASDHPFAGPTGPTSCGTCFPTTRTVHTRYYGVGGTYCPSGTTLFDGLCDVEFLIDAAVLCSIGVEDESWGKIKNLYR